VKVFRDGDHICIVTDHFVDLQTSPAVFLPAGTLRAKMLLAGGVYALSTEEIVVLYSALSERMRSLDCPRWGRLPSGHYGPCGECDACEISEWVT
jgi:hypothetical protein